MSHTEACRSPEPVFIGVLVSALSCSVAAVLFPVTGVHAKMTQDEGGNVEFRWDPKNLEIKTRSVEMTLEPLVMQVMVLF